jgi:hypothetical protein
MMLIRLQQTFSLFSHTSNVIMNRNSWNAHGKSNEYEMRVCLNFLSILVKTSFFHVCFLVRIHTRNK